MKYKECKDGYIIRLEKGEKIIETMLKFLEEKKIKAGYFIGLGAVSRVILGHYDLVSKKYSEKEVNEQREICSLYGNIARMDNKAYIHAHIVVGSNNMELVGGHLKEGVVAATCEIQLIKKNLDVNRKFDEVIGLNLYDF